MAPKRYYRLDENGWHHPLAKDQQVRATKLILRAGGTLALASHSRISVTQKLGLTAQLAPNESANTTMQVEAMKNIIVIITHSVTAKEKLLRVKQLEFSGQLYPVSVYHAADRDTCRGVIHQIPANTPSDTLLRNLSAPGYQILAARMMGQTTSALITFQGTYVPTTVRYEYTQIRCYTHRPKVQQCYKCLALGHRQDVCTQPTERCPECGFQNKSGAHNCITKCINCSGPHSALDELCPARIESSKITRKQEYAKRLATRKFQQAQAERHNNPDSRQNSTPNSSKRHNGLSYAQVITSSIHKTTQPL
ncbi:hypothetical protein HPB48_001001 [Haemaphysalis longicornis]|uniref:Tick transposon n=1 Tax=Haemaphysalis longicornis TaxID=44386 RepID=A0A9J6GZQ3_HAELO|nr:hypothetical protein HPB48_001001 [Haemaphysalis longicornis]